MPGAAAPIISVGIFISAGANYKPVFVPLRAIAIRLGRTLLHGSRLCAFAPDFSDLPGSGNGAGRSSSPIWSCSAWGLPCQPDCSVRGALLPHHFTLTGQPFYRQTRRYIFCGTFRKNPFERLSPAVSRHVALWRPDFPLACASGYPSCTCQCSVSHGLRCDFRRHYADDRSGGPMRTLFQ
jgi:hypothetical protein